MPNCLIFIINTGKDYGGSCRNTELNKGRGGGEGRAQTTRDIGLLR